MADQKIYVTVKSPDGIIFQGEATAVSSVNEKGKFDILPMHENFISIVKERLQVFENRKLVKEVKIDQAVLKNRDNKVEVFIGIEAAGKQ